MDDIRSLIDRLRKINALFEGTTFEGERQAAAEAMRRVKEQLREAMTTEQPVEYRFTMQSRWNRQLFVALLQRYGIQPYRYDRQRYTTVMARVTKSFVDKTLWPEYLKLSEVLEEYLADVTSKVVKQCIFEGEATVEVRQEPVALPAPQQPR